MIDAPAWLMGVEEIADYGKEGAAGVAMGFPCIDS
jgi:hypothetical protein